MSGRASFHHYDAAPAVRIDRAAGTHSDERSHATLISGVRRGPARLRGWRLTQLVVLSCMIGPDDWGVAWVGSASMQGDTEVSGGVSRHRAGQWVDHAVMSSGLATSLSFLVVSRAMEPSER